MEIFMAALLWVATLVTAIPTPEQENGEILPRSFAGRFPLSSASRHKRCSFPGGSCYRDSDCCFSRCGVRPAIWPPVPGRCQSFYSVSTSPTGRNSLTSSPPTSRPKSTPPLSPTIASPVSHTPTQSNCSLYRTVSTYAERTEWRSGGTLWLSEIELTKTITITPSCGSTSGSGSTISPIVTSTSGHKSTPSTTPCVPSYYTTTEILYVPTSAHGRSFSLTITKPMTVTYDPSCAFEHTGSQSHPTTSVTQPSSRPSPLPPGCTTTAYTYIAYSDYPITRGTTTEQGIQLVSRTTTETHCPKSTSSGTHSTQTAPLPTITTSSSPPATSCYNETIGYNLYSQYTSINEYNRTVEGLSPIPTKSVHTVCLISGMYPSAHITSTSTPTSRAPQSTTSPSTKSQLTAVTTTPCLPSTITFTYTDTFTSPYQTYTGYGISELQCTFVSGGNNNQL